MTGKSLTHGTPWKLILGFALPVMLGNLLQQLYNTADTIIVGNFIGEAALSSVGTCSSLTMLYLAIAQGFSIGAGVLTAQLFGAKTEGELRKTASTAILLLLGMGVVASIIGFVTAEPILKHALSVSDALLGNATIYFGIYALGLVFQFGYNIVAALLRSVGDSKSTLYFLLISSAINIALDILFVAVFHWGVAGAAIATVVSQLGACIASIQYMYRRYPVFRFSPRQFTFSRKLALDTLRYGAPMAVQQSIVSCGFFFIQRIVNSFGQAMTASFTVAMRIEDYMRVPTLALQSTMATYTGQNIGAQRIDRIEKGLRQTLVMALIATAAISLLAFLFPVQIINLFGLEGPSIAYCVPHIRAVSFGHLIFALYFPCLGIFQGVGQGGYATIVSTMALGCRVLFTYTLVLAPLIGPAAIWWSQPLGWIIAGVVCYTHYFRGTWKTKSIVDIPDAKRHENHVIQKGPGV